MKATLLVNIVLEEIAKITKNGFNVAEIQDFLKNLTLENEEQKQHTNWFQRMQATKLNFQDMVCT